jgi:hypothetical protein
MVYRVLGGIHTGDGVVEGEIVREQCLGHVDTEWVGQKDGIGLLHLWVFSVLWEPLRQLAIT